MRVLSLLLPALLAGGSLSKKHTRLPDCPLTQKDLFPESFVFGAASSSYQIEGGWADDGKGPSIWDVGVHDYPERITDRSNGDVAADSYHRFKEDIKALNETGFQSYRFSISWGRIMPTGELSTLNRAGLDYYHRLIDGLLEAGIRPIVTMFHWDLPQALEDLGGFVYDKFPDVFEEYADVLFKEYGSKVKDWITFNEPVEICDPGYGRGIKPPFVKGAAIGADYVCSYILLVAHAKAYHLYGKKYREAQKGRVGITLSVNFFYPGDGKDYESAEQGLQFTTGLYAHPIFSSEGGFPAKVVEEVARKSEKEGHLGSRLPEMDEETKRLIRGTSDFFGLNYYSSFLVALADPAPDSPGIDFDKGLLTYKDTEWETAKSPWLHRVPEGFRDAINWVARSYGNPEIWITENGWSDGGQLKDAKRVQYYREHLLEILKVLKCDDLNVSRYYAWSIIDNFEWMVGYTERFGLYNVNFSDPERPRTAKDSARFFRDVIRSRQVPSSFRNEL